MYFHFQSCPWGPESKLQPIKPDLPAHVTIPAIALVSKLQPDQPSVLANQPLILADQPKLQSDVAILFTNQPKLQSNQSQLQSDIPVLQVELIFFGFFVTLKLFQPHKPKLFSDKPILFTDQPILLSHFTILWPKEKESQLCLEICGELSKRWCGETKPRYSGLYYS